jgi:hypothetical protein
MAAILVSRTDSTEPGLDIIFDTEPETHQYWHKMQLLAKGGTYVLLGLLAKSLIDPWDKASLFLFLLEIGYVVDIVCSYRYCRQDS